MNNAETKELANNLDSELNAMLAPYGLKVERTGSTADTDDETGVTRRIVINGAKWERRWTGLFIYRTTQELTNCEGDTFPAGVYAEVMSSAPTWEMDRLLDCLETEIDELQAVR